MVVIFATGAKVFFVVDVVRLSVLFCNKPGFEAIDETVGIMFYFLNPSTANRFLVRRVRDKIPCLVFA